MINAKVFVFQMISLARDSEVRNLYNTRFVIEIGELILGTRRFTIQCGLILFSRLPSRFEVTSF